MVDVVKVGREVMEIRMDAGMKREYAASRLGVTTSALVKYERGERRIPDDIKLEMCRLYGCQLDVFFQED